MDVTTLAGGCENDAGACTVGCGIAGRCLRPAGLSKGGKTADFAGTAYGGGRRVSDADCSAGQLDGVYAGSESVQCTGFGGVGTAGTGAALAPAMELPLRADLPSKGGRTRKRKMKTSI